MTTAAEANTGTSPPPITYPPVPWLGAGGGVRGALRLFGPGAIIASVSIASGETLFSSRAGAIFGYGLLWFIVLAGACKLVQVYTGARFMILSGEHPMEAWVRLPGPRGWFPAILGGFSLLCFPFWSGGLSLMLGTVINWTLGFDTRDEQTQRFMSQLFGTGALLLAVTITILQTYRMLEIAQLIIVGLLLAGILAGVALAPVDWKQVIEGMLIPTLPAYESWLGEQYPHIAARQTALVAMVVFMGAIGGSTYDYIGYLGLFREKAWGALGVMTTPSEPRPIDLDPTNVRNGRRWLRAPIIDVFTGFVCVVVFTLAFNILGAAILNPQRLVPDKLAVLTPQVQFLTQFGAGFKYLYQIGILMAFWGTVYAGLELYCRTGYECFRPLVRRVRHLPMARFRPPVCLYAGLGGLVLIWTVRDPIRIVEPAALVGTLTCGLWCFAIIWADRRVLPAPLRMNAAWVVLNLAAGIVLTGFGAKAIADYVMSF